MLMLRVRNRYILKKVDKVSDTILFKEFTQEKFKGIKVAVWGDFILDEYIYTSTGRISREAPVLVTEYENNDFKLGGAGNVVQNIKSLGADPVPVGFIGKDRDGEQIKKIFADISVNTDDLVSQNGYRTPKKSRILSGRDNSKKQQVLRIDYLNKSIPDEHGYKILEEKLESIAGKVDLLLVSDYLKETVKPPVFSRLKLKYPDMITTLDSRENLFKFEGVSYVTPNEPEIRNLFPATKFLKHDDFIDAGNKLLSMLKCKGVVQKMGHKGMIVFEHGKDPVEIPIHGSQEIVDVTGAGDTVISLLSLSLAAGMNLLDSARLSNIGASLVVMKDGAYPLKAEELISELYVIGKGSGD